MMKTCRECGSLFAPTASQASKCDWQCRSCTAGYHRAYRATRKASGRPVAPSDSTKERRRLSEASRLRDPAVRAKRAAQMRDYAKAHGTAEHHRARWQVSRAIKAGRLTRKPCEVCGVQKVHAHHDDYSKPLDVRRLCNEHHRQHHAAARGQA